MRFLVGQHGLRPPQLEALHRLLFQTTKPASHRLSRIVSELSLPVPQALDILERLVESEVVHVPAIACPACGEEVSDVGEFCPNCGSELIDEWGFSVEGNLVGDELTGFKKYQDRKLFGEKFAKAWIAQGHVYYLLIDLVESEYHQRNSSEDYNRFFAEARRLLQTELLPRFRHHILALGEIGDCLKMAFLKANDAIEFLDYMTQMIERTNWTLVAPRLTSREAPFPSLDGTLGKVNLSSYERKTPKDLLVVTLAGQLDFNDIELTKLFRFDTGIKTSREVFKTSRVAVWIEGDVLSDLGPDWELHAKRPVNVRKHGVSYTKSFALMRLGGPGTYLESAADLQAHDIGN